MGNDSLDNFSGNSTKTFKLSDGSYINAYIIDSVGQEKYRRISFISLKSADSVFLVYDITSKSSLEELNDFSKAIKDRCENDIVVMVLGNKTDLFLNTQVSSEQGKEFADLHHYYFMEISCFNKYDVYKAFQNIIEITFETRMKKDNLPIKNNFINLKKTNVIKEEKKSCC